MCLQMKRVYRCRHPTFFIESQCNNVNSIYLSGPFKDPTQHCDKLICESEEKPYCDTDACCTRIVGSTFKDWAFEVAKGKRAQKQELARLEREALDAFNLHLEEGFQRPRMPTREYNMLSYSSFRENAAARVVKQGGRWPGWPDERR